MKASKPFLFSKIVGPFAFGLFIVALVQALDYSTTVELIQSYRQAEQMQDMLLKLKDTESLLKDVQRSHRGYVISGEEEFLRPFYNAVEELPQLLMVQEQYFKDNPKQQADFARLQELIYQKVAYVKSSVSLVGQGKQEQALQEVGQGKKLFDQIILLINSITMREVQQLDRLHKKVESITAQNRTVVVLASVISVLLLLLALWRIAADVNKVQQLQIKLEAANYELGSFNEELLTTNHALTENESKLMEAQQALKLREQQLLEAQELSKTGSFIWNVNENTVSYTKEYARMFRIGEQEQYTFQGFLGRLHPDDKGHVEQVVREAIKNMSGYQVEYRLNFPDQLVHVMVNGRPVQSADGVLRIHGTVADITSYKEAQAKLQAQEERFRALLESAPDAMIIADEQGMIVLANLQSENLFGYPRTALIGQPIKVLLPPRYRYLFANYETTYVENHNVLRLGLEDPLYAVDKEGKEFPVEVNLNPIKAGNSLYFAAAIRDVTERHKAEQKLKEAYREQEDTNKELTRASAELGTFSYSISHDLRAPLRAVSGYSSILKQEYGASLDEEGHKMLDIIRLNANRMGALIHSLLEFAKFGKRAVNKRAFDMHALVMQVLSDKQVKEGAKIVVDPMDPVCGDPDLLRQVWENLISNALKFSGRVDEPRIRISYSRKEDRQVFCIKDNGIGFDPAYSQDLFQVFKRLHPDQAFEGTGAGLAIAKRIVQGHSGEIWADAQPGAGATFCFSLPIEEEK